jgi:two-component system sensor histidine kinase UhpB
LDRVPQESPPPGAEDAPEAAPATEMPPRAPSEFRDTWSALPFRWQILITISIVALLASVLSGVFAVFDARTRADIETRANIELWTNHIAAKVRSLEKPTELQEFANTLDAEMASVRHVAVSIRDANGAAVAPTQHHTTKTPVFEPRAPSWFVALVQPDIESRTIDIAPHGQFIGSVLISGVPDDEIAEAWELLKLLALLWLGAIALMMVGLYFILGLVLEPLARLGGGMRELEVGHYAFRLDIPNVRELEPIAAAFNELAAALGQANAENSRLYRQLIAVQEDERREISRDLHDEFGPCLFGIMAGTTALAHHAKTLPPAQAAPILACVDEIVQVSNHLKSLNRALLNRLRPIALGRRTITELISELVATFERRHKGVRFDLIVGNMPSTFGEGIDLTMYRCIQEGVTNAIRHGAAQSIKIELSTVESRPKRAVEVRVTDDGRGIGQTVSYGYGLSSMRERVQELDGTLNIAPARSRGTVLTVMLPLSDDSGTPTS